MSNFPGPPVLFYLCVLAVAIPIGLLIGAAILRAACLLYNKIARATSTGRSIKSYPSPDEEGPGRFPGHEGIQDQPSEGFGEFRQEDRDYGSRIVVGVPEPEIPKAMGIVFVVGLANYVANFCISVPLLGGAAGMGKEGRAGAELMANLISIPVNFLIGSAILTAMLPTSFGKACLVALIQYLIVLAIAAVTLGVFLAAFAAGRRF